MKERPKTSSPFRDFLGILIFVVCVVAGTLFINTYIFRRFSVIGPSMESTLYTGDSLIVNRLSVTISQLKNEDYLPNRGEIIVFKNPKYNDGVGEEYIVKRVIGLPGDRVVLRNGQFVIYNDEYPDGFNPDSEELDMKTTNGSGDWTVSDGEIFVTGDHREDNYSYDSRNGLGMIPLYDVVGPVGIRIYPFNKITFF